jgi:cell division septal protein FtsQ
MSRPALKLRKSRARSKRALLRKRGTLAAQAAPGRRAPSRRPAERRAGPLSGWIWPAIGVLVFVEVLLLGGHAVRWAMTSPRFVLGEVKIVGHRTLAPAALVESAGLAPGSNLFGVDLERVRLRIESNPWVRRTSIRKTPPSTLRIEIEEREAVALINRRGRVAVDPEGVILGPLSGTRENCLPLLEGFSRKGEKPGDRINSVDFGAAVEAASLFSGGPLGGRECLSVRAAGGGHFKIRALGGKVNLLVSEEQMASQAARFHAVAQKILKKKKSAAPLYMDLTFPGRIVIRPANQDGGLRG